MPPMKNRLKIELINTYYQTSRANLANRLRLRDMAIMVFLLEIAILFALSFSRDTGYYQKPLLIIPFLSFAVMLLVNYYNEYIARIVHYVGHDLFQSIQQMDVSIPEWSSARGHLDLEKNQWLGANRAVAERIIICSPAVVALLLTINTFISNVSGLFSSLVETGIDLILLCGWPLGFVLLILAIMTNIKASRFKAGIYANLPARQHKNQ